MNGRYFFYVVFMMFFLVGFVNAYTAYNVRSFDNAYVAQGDGLNDDVLVYNNAPEHNWWMSELAEVNLNTGSSKRLTYNINYETDYSVSEDGKVAYVYYDEEKDKIKVAMLVKNGNTYKGPYDVLEGDIYYEYGFELDKEPQLLIGFIDNDHLWAAVQTPRYSVIYIYSINCNSSSCHLEYNHDSVYDMSDSYEITSISSYDGYLAFVVTEKDLTSAKIIYYDYRTNTFKEVYSMSNLHPEGPPILDLSMGYNGNLAFLGLNRKGRDYVLYVYDRNRDSVTSVALDEMYGRYKDNEYLKGVMYVDDYYNELEPMSMMDGKYSIVLMSKSSNKVYLLNYKGKLNYYTYKYQIYSVSNNNVELEYNLTLRYLSDYLYFLDSNRNGDLLLADKGTYMVNKLFLLSPMSLPSFNFDVDMSLAVQNPVVSLESMDVVEGQSVNIPLKLKIPDDKSVGSLQLDIYCNKDYFECQDVLKGPKGKEGMFDYNVKGENVSIGIINPEGMDEGVFAYLKVKVLNGSKDKIKEMKNKYNSNDRKDKFKVLGTAGIGSHEGLKNMFKRNVPKIRVYGAFATDKDNNEINVSVVNGNIKIISALEASKGDVNQDGKITSVDALLALQMAVGKIEPVPELADMDGDGNVKTNDALIILNMANEEMNKGMMDLAQKFRNNKGKGFGKFVR